MERRQVIVYTDGSCNNAKDDRRGGYGVVLRARLGEDSDKFDYERNYFDGCFTNTTSGRMELRAVCKAIEMVSDGWDMLVCTDSEYIVNSIHKGWLDNWVRKGILSEKANPDLWRRFIKARAKHGENNFNIKWVKGHADNELNELADELANKGRLNECIKSVDCKGSVK